MTPSKNQLAIYDFISTGTGNAVVNAKAGSGKTTTIVNGLSYIPNNAITYFIAFNKDIVKELANRVPKHINVSTIHSIGFTALKNTYGGHLNDRKIFGVLDTLKGAWFDEDNMPERIQKEYVGRVKKLADLYRLCLATTEDDLTIIAEKHEIENINGECKRAIQVVKAMNRNKREFDFIDMIYQPAVDQNIILPKGDFIFIDECQDLNAAQQKLFSKMLKPTSRFIAVGDPGQAIYGFAGADVDSFDNLKKMSNTIELPLSVSYRCGKKIIELAQTIVPDIEPAANAIEGEVNQTASFTEIIDGDLVLCRNCLPLVKMCLEFLRNNKRAYIRGGDIGKTLVNIIDRAMAYSLESLFVYLNTELNDTYERIAKKLPYLDETQIKEEPAYMLLNEKKLIFETICSNANVKTCDDLKKWIINLFSDKKQQGVCFSTIHKAKGHENNRVFIIERNLMPSKYAKKDWQITQENNIEYVAYTRAKQYLGFVSDWEYKKQRDI